MAVGVYQFGEVELRLTQVDLDRADDAPDDALGALLDACELAALAAGCRRVVFVPPASVSVARLRRRGYDVMNEGCAGSWLEKRF